MCENSGWGTEDWLILAGCGIGLIVGLIIFRVIVFLAERERR